MNQQTSCLPVRPTAPVRGLSVIELQTVIQAPIAACFDLARSIDAHLDSTASTGEKAIAGKTCGLAECDDVITWQARHLGVKQKLTVQITEMEPPLFFADEMLKGAFRYMRHEHRFESSPEGTLMRDHFCFAAPFGRLGQLFSKYYLEAYLRRFLQQRNQWLKQTLERRFADVSQALSDQQGSA